MKTLGTNSLASFWEWILTVTWGACWFAVAAFLILPLFQNDNSQTEFPIPLSSGPRYELHGPGGDWTLTATGAQLQTPSTHAGTAAWIAAGFFALVAYGLGLLRAVFCSLREGSPFTPANAGRLRRIGLTVLAIEALRVLVMLALVAPVVQSLGGVDGRTLRVDVWPSWTMIFVACVFLILAEVFRRGTAMQDEQDLTV